MDIELSGPHYSHREKRTKTQSGSCYDRRPCDPDLSSKTEFKTEKVLCQLERTLRGDFTYQCVLHNANTGPSTASFLTGRHFIKTISRIKETNLWNPCHCSKNPSETGTRPLFLVNGISAASPKVFLIGKPIKRDHFITPNFELKGKKNIEGPTTDVITDLFIEWLFNRKRNSARKPFFAFINYNGTRRPWMPALRHLELYDDILLPEPSTLFEEHRGRAPPSRYQEMNIHRNLGLEVDLFLPKLEDAKKKESPNTHSVKS